jgi:predicted  nucleic acid-binding Zn-ribbon protein
MWQNCYNRSGDFDLTCSFHGLGSFRPDKRIIPSGSHPEPIREWRFPTRKVDFGLILPQIRERRNSPLQSPRDMANPTPPSDQASSLSAAELRRRLLASTPPPIAAHSATTEPLTELVEEEVPDALPVPQNVTPTAAWTGGTQDLLARLRMPGKSGSVPVPTARPAAQPTVPVVPEPVRPAVNRRTPSPGGSRYGDPSSAIAGALNQLADLSHGSNRYDDSPGAEIQRLRSENKELRTLLDEMKQLLQEASNTEQQLVSKEQEFEQAIAEKDSQIQELSEQLGAIEEQIAKGELVQPPPVPKTRSELEEWGDELEQESSKLAQDRKRLEDERRQLREDEEALEQQMRQMEVSMARERAMIARQETELKRLSAEIQHELDILQRGDAGLREQMAKFQRRAQEVMTKPPGNPPGGRR